MCCLYSVPRCKDRVTNAMQDNWERWCDRVFARIDSDGSGYVDLQEIMECEPSHLLPLCHKHAAA
jgi:hypothetical protein